MTKKNASAGLRGQIAGETSIATVGAEGHGLTYRGYDVKDLAAHTGFEEVAHLLLRGRLPTEPELVAYRARLASMRDLPPTLVEVLERIPADAHPMDVMRTGVLGARAASSRRRTTTTIPACSATLPTS